MDNFLQSQKKMKSRERIIYYKVRDPLKEREIIFCNREHLHTLLQEGSGYPEIRAFREIRRVLYVDKKEKEDKERVKNFEKTIAQEIEYKTARIRGTGYLSLSLGIAITYLITPYASKLGALISYPFVSAFGVNPENLPAIILVLILPLFFGIRGFLMRRREGKDLAKRREVLLKFKECPVVEDETLREFFTGTESILKEIEKEKLKLLSGKNKKEKLIVCKKIKNDLMILSQKAKYLELNEIGRFYTSLINKIFLLKKKLERSLFPASKARKYLKEKKIRKYPFKTIALLILLLSFFLPGVYSLNEDEIAIVTRKEFSYAQRFVADKTKIVKSGGGKSWHWALVTPSLRFPRTVLSARPFFAVIPEFYLPQLGNYHKINLKKGEKALAKVYGVEKSEITGKENEREMLFLKINFTYHINPERVDEWLTIDAHGRGKEYLERVIAELFYGHYFYQKLRNKPELAVSLPTFQKLLKEKTPFLLEEYRDEIRTSYQAASEITRYSSGLYNQFVEDFIKVIKNKEDPASLAKDFSETLEKAYLEENFGVRISQIKVEIGEEPIGIRYDEIRKLREEERKKREKK